MIQGGLSDQFLRKKLGIDVVPVLTDLSDTFDMLNTFTHINPTTFGISNSAVASHAESSLQAATYLIEHIRECRGRVLSGLRSAIDKHVMSRALSETIVEIDELATHHLVDTVMIENSEIASIGSTSLMVSVEGNVEVELQYGSGSDLKNDMGAVIDESFPFTAQIEITFKRPLGSSASVSELSVDTSSWYE